MRKILLPILLLYCTLLAAESPIEKVVGVWVTFDDKTGEKSSVVKIFKATNGMYYGKTIEIYNDKYRNAICMKCKDENKDKPVVGMTFMKEMKIEGNMLRGNVVDPDSGNTYYCTIILETEDRLRLRGSLDKKGMLGRTQYWTRQK